MSDRAILDTSFLVALFDDRDVWYPQALKIKGRLENEGLEMVVLDCVIGETISTVARRFRERRKSKGTTASTKQITGKIPRDSIEWAYPEVPRLYRSILSLFEKHAGQLNFHDCLIALTAKEKKIKEIVSFDEDFDRVPWLERIE